MNIHLQILQQITLDIATEQIVNHLLITVNVDILTKLGPAQKSHSA